MSGAAVSLVFHEGLEGREEKSRYDISAKDSVLVSSFTWFRTSNICQGKFCFASIFKKYFKFISSRGK